MNTFFVDGVVSFLLTVQGIHINEVHMPHPAHMLHHLHRLFRWGQRFLIWLLVLLLGVPLGPVQALSHSYRWSIKPYRETFKRDGKLSQNI